MTIRRSAPAGMQIALICRAWAFHRSHKLVGTKRGKANAGLRRLEFLAEPFRARKKKPSRARKASNGAGEKFFGLWERKILHIGGRMG